MSLDSRPPLDNAELRQYRALLEVAESISVHRDLKSLFRDLATRLQLVVKFDGVNVVFYDPEHNLMRMNILESVILGQADIPHQLAVEDAPAGWVWQTQQPLLMEDLPSYSARYPKVIPDLVERNVKTAYVLPLTSVGRRLGAIGFGSVQENAWSENDREFLQQVAKQVAVAVDNTLNFENASAAETALARERDRLRLLLEINNAVVSQLDLRELLDVISSCLRQAIPHDAALLSLYDPESSELHLLALDLQMFGNVPLEEGARISAENTPEGEAIATGKPVLVGPVLDLTRFSSPWVRQAADNGVKSGCAVPLISHNRTLGALSVVSLSENAFHESDVALLVQCANQIAIAVENALNFERARDTEQQAARERDRIKLLLEINNAVVSHLDLSELVKTVSASLRDVMPHDAAGIALYEPEQNQLREYKNVSYRELETFREGDVIPLEGTPAGKVFLTGQPLLIRQPDPAAYPADLYSQQPVEGSPKSACLALLSAHGRKLGIVGISSTQEEGFTEQDLELFSRIAEQIAIALENSLNFERALKAEQEVKRQFERLRLMLEVNNATVSHLDLRELVRVTAACLREVLGYEIVGLSLYDEKNNQLRAYAYDSPDKRLSIQQGTLVPMEGSLGGLALTSGQPIFYNRVDSTASISDFNKRLIEGGIESGGCVPLIVHGRKLGVLGVASFRENAFPEERQQLLGQIAGQIAIAVDNALNFQRAREAEQEATHQSDRLSTVLQINNAVVSQLDLHELLQVVSRSLRKTVHNDTTGVALYDPESNKLRVVMTDFPEQMNLVEESYLIALEGSAMGEAFTSGQPIFLDQFDLERFPSEFTRRSYEAGLRSACNIPLIARGRKLGALGVASKRPFAFSAEDRELLCQSANQIAIAVENALSFERTRAAEEEANRQSDRLQLLLQVNNAIASALDLPSLFQAVSACLRQVFRHDYAVMGLYDDQQDILRVHLLDRAEGIDYLQEGQIATLEDTPVGLAIRTKQPVVTGTDYLKQFPAEVVRRAVSQGIRANCSVPLLWKNRIIGAMSMASKTECAFTKADGEFFMQIAGQVAIAVENALNFERTRTAEEEAKRQSDRRQLLLEINNAMVAQLDLRSLIQIISVSLRRISLHDVVGLALYDPDTNQLRAYAYESLDKQFAIEEGTLMPLDSSLSGAAFVSGEPIFHDRIDEQRFQSDFSKRFRAAGLKSGGVVPLIAHGRKLGTLSVASYREANLNEDEKELLCQVANQVALAVENALAFREIEALKNKLTSEKLYLEDEIRTQHNFEELIGESQTFKRILKQVETVASTDSTVLICGETGTGKELIARAIHDLSNRRERTLVKINCAAIPTGLLESELFGHEKGAFTGAISQRVGRFELANRGSLFLDEVGDIPLDLQPKLLRVLQEQEFERLGSTRTQKVDVRLIAATNCDLEQMVADRKYRSDLFYRLNVFPITIPPLRQRREDIPALTRFFTQRYARRLKKQITSIPAEIMAALTNYHWPGNVRELEHFIERAVILTRGDSLEVSLAELKSSEPAPVTELATLHDAERDHILRALEETNWIVGGPQGAAARLGMKRTTLQSKMQKLGIGRQS